MTKIQKIRGISIIIISAILISPILLVSKFLDWVTEGRLSDTIDEIWSK